MLSLCYAQLLSSGGGGIPIIVQKSAKACLPFPCSVIAYDALRFTSYGFPPLSTGLDVFISVFFPQDVHINERDEHNP